MALPGRVFSQREISRITGIPQQRISEIEQRAIAKLRAKLAPDRRNLVHIQASTPVLGVVFGNPADLGIQAAAADALPTSICWMPAGKHQLTAHTLNAGPFSGQIICDEQACRAVNASFASIQAAGQRVWLDFDHNDGAASAWVTGFTWDASKGIMANLKWTPAGESAVRDGSFFSFSPAFAADQQTGRVVGLLKGHAAGGLVNAPAFGAAMPALIAARLGNPINQPSKGGDPTENQTTMKEKYLKILAALKVTAPTDATDEQLVDLIAKHSTPATDISPEIVALKASLKTMQDAEVARVAVQAKADKDAKDAAAAVETQLAEIKAAQVALRALNAPGRVEVIASVEDVVKGYAKINIKNEGAMQRGIFFRDNINPVIAKIGGISFGQQLGRSLAVIAKIAEVQAANSLGTLVGNLVQQRALALLKLKFPLLSLLSTDFSDASIKKGQTVFTRLKTAIAASHYTGTFTAADSTDTDVPVVIDTHTYAQVAFNANELASTNRDLFGEQAEVLNYAVGKDIMDALYALLTIANFPTTALILGGTGAGTATGDGTGYARKSAQFQAKQLNVNLIPDDGRFNLLNCDAFAALAADPSVVSLAVFQKPEIITGYELPRIAGMQPVEVVNLPTTGNMVSFAGAARALAIATRVPNDYTTALSGSSYGNVSTVTDPDTGMTVMNTQYVNHDTGTSNSRVSVMRGVAVGDPVAAIITKHS